jgi:hypothetical protein
MILFAGPYNFEFGHELFSFQGYIRDLSKIDYYDSVTVCSKRSMSFLYEDFVDEFIPLEEFDLVREPRDVEVITQSFCQGSVSSGSGRFEHDQLFVKYGSQAPPNLCYDIVFHARTLPWGMCMNLDQEVFQKVSDILSKKYRIAFMGSQDGSSCPEGVEDIRGIELKKLADVLHSCRLVVGQSSGPIHFASLCGAKHLTWGGHRFRTFARYVKHWNPLNSACYIFEERGLGYINNRWRIMGLSREILEEPHVNVVEIDNFRSPTVDDLLNSVDSILNG